MSQLKVTFLAFFLINAVWGVSASKNHYPLTIEVLSGHMESFPIEDDNNGAPKDCGIQDYSAYCHHARTALVRNRMVVQDSNGKSFTIACEVELQRSKCVLLPVGRKFEARKQKGGIEVLYPDAKGKERKQLYQLVPDVPAHASGSDAGVNVNSQLSATEPLPDSQALESGSPAEAIQAGVPEKVKCSFSSTPSGADIAIDGRYVGNTPSEISLSPGTHEVVFTLSGFDRWTRELTVTPDSAVNVAASLQRAQP
jgi:hypothetical protein